MGHIKEPENVDFVIQSDPLTDKDRKEISKYITEYKKRRLKNMTQKSKKKSQKKSGVHNN